MRRTINKQFELEGVGLHKGEKSRIVFKPQDNPSGVRFFPEGKASFIEADLKNLHSTARGTNLTDGKNYVYTVEHALSALYAFNIDDADIELYGNEPPALDGSALPYAENLSESGLREKKQEGRKVFSFEHAINFEYKNSSYLIEKSDDFIIDCHFENKHPLIGDSSFHFIFDTDNFISQISPARTFGFKNEIEYLKKNQLALGGSLDNAIVLDEKGMLNSQPLRFKDEFVRHKILDLIGDLSLSGLRFEKVKITAKRPSHEANIKLASALADKEAR